MKTLLTTFCLTITVLLGSVGQSFSGDLRKGYDAAQKGDYATALREWTPLAEQGDATAQYNLGLMYAKGKGVPKDDKTAVKWYRLSAEQGYVSGQNNLGNAYRHGRGVLQDYETAVKWFRLAAEQGEPVAHLNLSWSYENGEGIPQDFILAHMWANIAASSGDKEAISNRDRLARKMTTADISTAQKLARDCVSNNYKNCDRAPLSSFNRTSGSNNTTSQPTVPNNTSTSKPITSILKITQSLGERFWYGVIAAVILMIVVSTWTYLRKRKQWNVGSTLLVIFGVVFLGVPVLITIVERLSK